MRISRFSARTTFAPKVSTATTTTTTAAATTSSLLFHNKSFSSCKNNSNNNQVFCNNDTNQFSSFVTQPKLYTQRRFSTTNSNNNNKEMSATSATGSSSSENPLLTPSPLPHGFPQYDKIRNEHYEPAFEAAMEEHKANVEKIANQTEAPTFENTLIALERAGEKLDYINNIFSSMNSGHTNETLQAIDVKMSPKLSAHSDSIFMNDKLFQRVAVLHKQHQEGTLRLPEPLKNSPNPEYDKAENERLLWRYHRDFVRAGAELSKSDKERLSELNGQISEIQTKIQQAILASMVGASVGFQTAADLEGFSADEIAAAKHAADEEWKKLEEQGLKTERCNFYTVKMRNTSQQPCLAKLKKRASREKILKASLARGSSGGKNDTREHIVQLVTKRAERAKLFGYKSHAAYVLADEMVGTCEKVNDLLKRLVEPAKKNCQKEKEELEKLAKQKDGLESIAAHDWNFYTEQVREAKYAFDEAKLKPYFALDKVINDGLFYFFKQFYNVSFVEVTEKFPVWEPSVKVYEVRDDSEGGKLVGLFTADMYERDSKQGGAWMSETISQSRCFNTLPIVHNTMSVTPPAPGSSVPALVSVDDVTTIAHEAGHMMNGMLSNCQYPRLSGTSAESRDFVEFHSQVNEFWALEPYLLKNYAKHYETKEVIPTELVEKLEASKKFNEGYATCEYLAACVIDQAFAQLDLETCTKILQKPEDVTAFEEKTLKEWGLKLDHCPPRYRSCYFMHVFAGGYGAAYSSYVLSEILDAEGEKWFRENGLLTRENGDRFRKLVLGRSGSTDPSIIVREFLGHEPQVEPLLKRRGLMD